MQTNLSFQSEKTNQDTILLTDGRRLGYTEYGVPGGRPVFYFHGCPGSSLDLLMMDLSQLERYNLRIIAVDRPGMGQSTFQPGRTFLDCPADVAALADRLSIDRFAVFGISGGGPYAIACASRLPERVTRLVLVSSVGPFDAPNATVGMGAGKLFFTLARWAPWLVNLQFAAAKAGLQKDPQVFLRQATQSFSPPDQAAFADEGVRSGFAQTMRHALLQGARGITWDAGLVGQAWGFDLGKIRVPAVLFHGEADTNAPVAMGRYLAKTIPTTKAFFLPGEGHFSIISNQTDKILASLAE